MFSIWNFSWWLVTVLAILISVVTIAHVLMHKRESHAAFSWVLASLLLPFIGPVLYLFFGINRSKRRLAQSIKKYGYLTKKEQSAKNIIPPEDVDPAYILLGSAVTGLPLVAGNRVAPLMNGEQAFPAMLSAIENAKQSIYLCIYIFENKKIGAEFITALTQAKNRGVMVYVLLDGVGAWYSLNRTRRLLIRAGVSVENFLPPRLFPVQLDINLRNHRKILIVDGKKGFTGGMNIRHSHLLNKNTIEKSTRGAMFLLEGPIVAQIAKIFEDDWYFASGVKITQKIAGNDSKGAMLCRTIVDGPDEHINTLINLLVGAFSMAKQKITIVTPYFVPPAELISALQAAALRGIEVSVILPERTNLIYVDWASKKILPGLLTYGIRIFYQPAPFDHSKLLVIDNHYSLIGSFNFDSRSLRLNFELAVEVYDKQFSSELIEDTDRRKKHSRVVSSDEFNTIPVYKRIWYGFWWLFSPYL